MDYTCYWKNRGKRTKKWFSSLSEKRMKRWTAFTKTAHFVKRGLTRHGEWCTLKTINWLWNKYLIALQPIACRKEEGRMPEWKRLPDSELEIMLIIWEARGQISTSDIMQRLKKNFLCNILVEHIFVYSLIFAGMDSYGIPANDFRMASKIIFAPLHGTAMPICLRTLSLLPSKT